MVEFTAARVHTDMEEGNRDRADEPTAKRVTCPSCKGDAFAIVPEETTIVDSDETVDGKVWVNCLICEDRFLVYYQNDT